MNDFLRNVHKVEFAVTMACTGRCRHCQNGEVDDHSGHLDEKIAVKTLRSICKNHDIRTVMTFGGEPLLYPDVVCAIHRTATDVSIERRQIITNGFFSKQHDKIMEVVQRIAESEVNDLLLSVDAFHQESIPLETVLYFAECVVKSSIPIRLQPAWLVSKEDDNPYNVRTREILKEFEPLRIPTGAGNVVFPSGNALKYLHEYFDDITASSPYEEDPGDLRTISIGANGDVLNGIVYIPEKKSFILTGKLWKYYYEVVFD